MEHKVLLEWSSIASYLTTDRVLGVMRAAVVVLLALLALPMVRRAVQHFLGARLHAAQLALTQRFASYAVIALGLTWTLKELGFEIGVLLGAAGVVTVAVGFAAQTSVSNVISGLFLLVEGSFTLGDTIEVTGVTGEVLSIDLLSVKLRTPDHVFVRMPNETLLKSTVSNLTRFPRRAADIAFAVHAAANVPQVRDLALAAAAAQEGVLSDPKPAFAVLGSSSGAANDTSGMRLQVTVWSERATLQQTKNAVHMAIQAALLQAAVERPALPVQMAAPTAAF